MPFFGTTYFGILCYLTFFWFICLCFNVITYILYIFLLSSLGYEWIGWRNDTPGLVGKPVEIVFKFDTVRNFSAIVLHANNMFTKDVQVSVKTNF